MKALVFGATGQLGVAMSEQLIGAGWQVVAVTRNGRRPPAELLDRGVRLLDGTDKTPARVFEDLGQTVDAVFDPTTYTAEDAHALTEIRGKVGSLIVVSSSSVYMDTQGRSLDQAAQTGFPRFDGPIPEDTLTVGPGPETYSTRKVAMERACLSSGMPVTVLRPCAVYGKHGRHPREWWFVKRALDGRRGTPVAYGAESLFHTSSALGIAALAELCMRTPSARILNVADPAPLSVRGIAAAIERAIDRPLPLMPYEGPATAPAYVGSTPWSAERPFLLDTARAQALGWDGGAPYAEGVTDVCRWLVDAAGRDDWRARFTRFAQYGYDPFDYDAEDAFVSARGLQPVIA